MHEGSFLLTNPPVAYNLLTSQVRITMLQGDSGVFIWHFTFNPCFSVCPVVSLQVSILRCPFRYTQHAKQASNGTNFPLMADNYK